jgi:peptidoglycan glycosyltransferase
MQQEQKLAEKASIKRQKYRNKEYTFVSVFFVLIFLSLIGYLIYFDGAKSQEFINSPYNTRQDTFADRVVRGEIQSSDGQVLARTDVAEDGSEERVYPYGNIFSHVVGYDSNGKSGLESEANFQLLSSHSFFLKQLKNQFNDQKNQGDTVISTLDSTIQTTAYNALGDRNGAVIAIEPSTGRILAMVSKPDFDPNTIEEEWDSYVNDSESSNLLNRATNGQYPPGSTFKIVTALDYFRENGTFENYSYTCEGSITEAEHTIRCYNGTVHGVEDFYSAFANSCNSAFADIGISLGGKSLLETSEDLLFNQKLPLSSAKQSTFTLDGDSPVPLIMQTAIGQGNTLVSPLHMALITCSIANHGVLMQPYLIDQVVNDEGQSVSKTKPEAYRRLMSNNEANLLDKLMTGVVESGTATALSGRSYSVAGKTGSAEYDESGASHSWFVGYCSKDDPDLVVAVIVENGGTGSQAAVPIAGEIFDAYYTSHAAQVSEEETSVDYSDYEDSSSSDNGWFDIAEEVGQIFHEDGTTSSWDGSSEDDTADPNDTSSEWGVETGGQDDTTGGDDWYTEDPGDTTPTEPDYTEPDYSEPDYTEPDDTEPDYSVSEGDDDWYSDDWETDVDTGGSEWDDTGGDLNDTEY